VDPKNKIEPFTLFMLHHAFQKKPQQASIKMKVIEIRKKLQNLRMIDGLGSFSVCEAGSESPNLFTYM
jgi:hypothetical protein